MRRLYVFLLLLFVGPASAQSLQNAFPNLIFPGTVDIQAPGDGSNRLFVVEQPGTIRLFNNDAATAQTTLFLDISPLVFQGNNRSLGMSGLVFHPSYVQNGLFYVSYTADAPLRLVVARYAVSATDPNQADASSEALVLEVPLPGNSHHAGQLQFGPDGYLYLSLGDGEYDPIDGDPFENGQDPTTLLGSLLRLDVDGGGLPLDCGAGTGLAMVPPDNPLSDGPGNVCDEIYAYGFRNPWRFSFGPDDRLWLGDVGQVSWEEVDIVEAGGNYGWNTLEGTHCYDPDTGCDPSGTILPIHEYPHVTTTEGGQSVIGGYVYTGNTCAPVLDRYIYGDFVTGNVWALTYDGQTADNDVLVGLSGAFFTTLGQDEQGEIYLADAGSDQILSLDCATDVAVSAAVIGDPVTIPSGGGPLSFDVTLTNTTAETQAIDVWVSADVADGTERNAVVGPQRVRLPAGFSGTGNVTLIIPGLAPAGVSTGVVKVGAFPDGPTDADRFTITKEPALAAAPTTASEQWYLERFDFAVEDEAVAARAGAAAPAVSLSAYPTPFAAHTTVRYALGGAGLVRLAVYDVLGREVALLADGQAEAGEHEAAFDASVLPSGVYLVRLEAAGTVEVASVTRLR